MAQAILSLCIALQAAQVESFSTLKFSTPTGEQRAQIGKYFDDVYLSGMNLERWSVESQGILCASGSESSPTVIKEFRFIIAVDQKRDRSRVITVGDDVFVEGLVEDRNTRRFPPGVMDVLLRGSDGAQVASITNVIAAASQGSRIDFGDPENDEDVSRFFSYLDRRTFFNPLLSGFHSAFELRARGRLIGTIGYSRFADEEKNFTGFCEVKGVTYAKFEFPGKVPKGNGEETVNTKVVRFFAFRDGLPVKNQQFQEIGNGDDKHVSLLSTVNVAWKKKGEVAFPVHLRATDADGSSDLEAEFKWDTNDEVLDRFFEAESVGYYEMGGRTALERQPGRAYPGIQKDMAEEYEMRLKQSGD